MGRRRVRVVSAEIHRAGCWLLVQRSAQATLPLLWEFPGGRVRQGETDQQALTRALRKRIGCDGALSESVMEITHAYPDYDLTLAVYRCDLGQATPVAGAVNAIAWVTPDRFTELQFPDADQRTIDQLLLDDITAEVPRGSAGAL